MRKWSVAELEAIESDLSFIESVEDYEWLGSRINIRAAHWTYDAGQCDACGITGEYLMRIMDEYPDDMGGPSTLGIVYLCYNDR